MAKSRKAQSKKSVSTATNKEAKTASRMICRLIDGGWSREKIAQSVGVSWLTIHRWRHGRCAPQANNAEKLRAAVASIEVASVPKVAETALPF